MPRTTPARPSACGSRRGHVDRRVRRVGQWDDEQHVRGAVAPAVRLAALPVVNALRAMLRRGGVRRRPFRPRASGRLAPAVRATPSLWENDPGGEPSHHRVRVGDGGPRSRMRRRRHDDGRLRVQRLPRHFPDDDQDHQLPAAARAPVRLAPQCVPLHTAAGVCPSALCTDMTEGRCYDGNCVIADYGTPARTPASISSRPSTRTAGIAASSPEASSTTPSPGC